MRNLPKPGVEPVSPALTGRFLSTGPPGDLSDPGIEPGSRALQADSLPAEPPAPGAGFGEGSLGSA